jgi:hypothetical protein
MGIFMRWLAAFLLLAATLNPTGANYVAWAGAHWHDQLPLTVLMGLLLLVGYAIAISATLNSIGSFGMVVIAAIFGCTVWVLEDWGMLSLSNGDVRMWLGIAALSVVFAAGLSWGLIKQRLTGQATVDDIDD